MNNHAKAGQYLTFRLEYQTYAVPIGTVREINRVNRITLVPRTPLFVSGVMNLRGNVIPVIDLRVKFSLPKAEQTRETCTIVIDGPNGHVGMIVDAVSEVMTFSPEQLEPAPQTGGEACHYVMGIGKAEQKVILLIDVFEVLSRGAGLTAAKTEMAA